MKKLSIFLVTIVALSCVFALSACNQCADGHTWDEGKVVKEPTCVTDGEMEFKCTVCGTVRTETIPETGHKQSDKLLYEIVENKLYSYNSCANCSEKLNRTEILYVKIVDDVASLTSAVAEAVNGDTIALKAGTYALTDNLSVGKSITMVGVGDVVVTTFPVYIGETCDVTIRNITFSTPVNANNNASSLYASDFSGKLEISGCTFLETQWDSIQITPKNGAEIIIDGCNFANETVRGQRFIHIQADDAGDVQCAITITDNSFGACANMGNSLIDVDYVDYTTMLTAYGNTFVDDKDTLVNGYHIYLVTKNVGGVMMDLSAAYDMFVAAKSAV